VGHAGCILTKRGELEAAAQAFDQGVRSGGKAQPLLLAHFARVYALQGDTKTARQMLLDATLIKRPLTTEEKAEIQDVRRIINAE